MVHTVLGKLHWGGKLYTCTIVIRHRGAPLDQKTIPGASITEVKKGYFSYQQGGREITIPFHRILEIRCQEKTVWKRQHEKP